MPSDQLDYEADEVLVVSDPAQLRAAASPPRMAIVRLLRVRARSVSELAGDLGVPKGTVGHHVKVLENAGLIRVVRTRKVRALTEKYYGRVARLFLFKTEDAPETGQGLAAAALRQAADEIERATDRTGFSLVRARLTPAEVKRFDGRLKRLVNDFREAESPDGALHVLSTAFWADPGDA